MYFGVACAGFVRVKQDGYLIKSCTSPEGLYETRINIILDNVVKSPSVHFSNKLHKGAMVFAIKVIEKSRNL